MREQVVGLVEELEARPSGPARMFGADRQGGEDITQWLDHVEHQPDGDLGEDLHLLVVLVHPAEEPVEKLEEHLVGDIAEVGDGRGLGIADQVGGLAVLGGPHECRQNGSGELHSRVRGAHREKLVEDAQEASEVGVTPISPRPLTLFDDGLDRLDHVVEAR